MRRTVCFSGIGVECLGTKTGLRDGLNREIARPQGFLVEAGESPLHEGEYVGGTFKIAHFRPLRLMQSEPDFKARATERDMNAPATGIGKGLLKCPEMVGADTVVGVEKEPELVILLVVESDIKGTDSLFLPITMNGLLPRWRRSMGVSVS